MKKIMKNLKFRAKKTYHFEFAAESLSRNLKISHAKFDKKSGKKFNKFQMIFFALFLIFFANLTFFAPNFDFSSNNFANAATTDCANNPKGAGCPCDENNANSKDNPICKDLTADDSETAFSNIFKNIINTLLFVAGIIAVVMIVLSGMRMVASRGQPDAVKKARNTLLYSVIGLVVATVAFAVVNFVIGKM